MHTVKETDMLATKLDLLMKKLDEGNRPQMSVPVHAMNSYFTCEVCGVLALLKYPFYPLFILDNGMNLISKSLTVLTPA